MIEETVFSADQQIRDAVAVKITGARTRRMSGKFLFGEIALVLKPPGSVDRLGLPPKHNIL